MKAGVAIRVLCVAHTSSGFVHKPKKLANLPTKPDTALSQILFSADIIFAFRSPVGFEYTMLASRVSHLISSEDLSPN